jgi:hypothetical protein
MRFKYLHLLARMSPWKATFDSQFLPMEVSPTLTRKMFLHWRMLFWPPRSGQRPKGRRLTAKAIAQSKYAFPKQLGSFQLLDWTGGQHGI